MEGSVEHSEPRPEAPAKPPRVPGYVLDEVLGRGSTGVVYKGRQLAVDREVAVKVLHPELAQKKRVVQRLQREARTTARLAHPHIVSAIDMGELDGVWWYAMEFVDGPTLGERLKQEERLSEREALRLFIPLCEALVHAWEHGVVHRDIKPANILIDSVGGARLADLGLAFMDDDPSLTGSEGTLGTPHYMSPEQARSPADADVRSDIWSFGATFFHAVCGRTPFTGDSLAEVLSGVLYARVPDPLILQPGLSKGLALILRKCLSREPAARYQTPFELLLDLERVRERRLPKISRRHLDPVDRGRRRGVTLALLGVTGVLAGAAIATALWWGERGELGPAEGRAQPFAPLDSLVQRVADLPEATSPQLFSLLTELRDLEDEVPERERGRFIGLRTDLRGRLRGALSEILRSVGDAADELVRDEDYRGALELLDEEFARELFARTGFTLDALPADQREIATSRLGFARSSVVSGAAAAASSLRRVLERHLEDVLFPQVSALRETQRWRSAVELLDLDDEELLRRARFSGARFPADLVEERLDDIRIALFAKRAELDADWGRVDQELRRWVEARANQLSQRLRDDRSFVDSAGELQRAFEREVSARGLRDGELHPAGLTFARGELEARARALGMLEETLREQRAREELSVLREVSRPHWKLREYEALRDRFDAFTERVHNLPGDSSAAWRADLVSRTSRVRREAQLLAGLLERAAAGVEALNGRSTRLRLGSITVSGVVEVRESPLERSFLFTSDSGTEQRVSLRTLNPLEVERLAGLRPDGALSERFEDRLLVALFRYHEGDSESAESVMRDLPRPTGGPDAELVGSLSERIAVALGDRESERAAREERAQFLLEAVRGRQYDRATALDFVEQLLDDYDDLGFVREARSELRRQREELSAAPFRSTLDGVARAYALTVNGPGPTAPVSLAGRNRVRLRFDFAAESSVWDKGEWIADGEGWTSLSSDRLRDVLQQGPRLALRAPLDPLRAEVEVVLRIEQLYDSGAPRCTIVSIAGYHFALVGPSLASKGPRWLLETRGLDMLVDRIEAGDGESVPALLKQGQRHELHFVVKHRPSTFEFRLDGRTITSSAVPSPTVEDPEIAIRAWEKVRLLSAEVVAQMR